jgi:hypothetical protein
MSGILSTGCVELVAGISTAAVLQVLQAGCMSGILLTGCLGSIADITAALQA